VVLAAATPADGAALRHTAVKACHFGCDATKQGAASVFPVSRSEFRGPPSVAGDHFSYASMEEVWNVATAEAFHTSSSFRDDLRLFASRGAMKGLFAEERFSSPSWAQYNDPVIIDAKARGILEAANEANRRRLRFILEEHIGPSAPSVAQFVGAFALLCGEGRRGMFTACDRQPPHALEVREDSNLRQTFVHASNTPASGKHAAPVSRGRLLSAQWHQDWGPPDDSFTVMLGFPPADSYAGVGVLTELVLLSHRFRMDDFRQSIVPLQPGIRYTVEEAMESDRKGWQALGVTDAYRVQPVFKLGQELLVYRDAHHLHRSPAADLIRRESIWRFQ
jgi:hypothetical protein